MRHLRLINLIYLCFKIVTAGPVQGRGIFDPLESLADSVFGITTSAAADVTDVAPPVQATTSSAVAQTLNPPAVVTSISSEPNPSGDDATNDSSQPTSSTKSSESPASSTTTTPTSTSSSVSIESSTESSSITSSTKTSSTQIPPAPLNTSGGVQPTTASSSHNSQSSSSNGTKISTSGIAVAVVLAIALLAVIGYLIFKFCPPVQRRYQAWQERKMKARTYREALDGPQSRKGLGLGEVEELKAQGQAQPRSQSWARPFSFQLPFHTQSSPPSQQQEYQTRPMRQEIKRKPLPWNANVPPGIGVALPMDQTHTSTQ